MTRKKPRCIPTDDDLADRFDSQAFRDMLAENWPGKRRPKRADVEVFAERALGDARLYIADAVKPAPKQSPDTDEPLMSPIQEAAINFARNLQLTYLTVTGRLPSFTATRRWRGPFAKILHQCLVLLHASEDDIRWINTLQSRSNAMTDRRGQPRRKRGRRKRSPTVPE